MSTTAVIAIVIAVVVVLAAVAFFTLARRSDVRGAGALSGETVKRDRAARSTDVSVASGTTASDVEAAGTAARVGTAIAVVDHDSDIVPWTPPDPEVIGESRRQFFNRATVGLMSIGIVIA